MAVRPLIVAAFDAVFGFAFAARLRVICAQPLVVRLLIRDRLPRRLAAVPHGRSRLDLIATQLDRLRLWLVLHGTSSVLAVISAQRVPRSPATYEHWNACATVRGRGLPNHRLTFIRDGGTHGLMDFNKLSQNEKLAVYGSVAVIIGAIIGGAASALGWLALLAAVAMLVVIFLPQMSPQTALPGSRGSIMLLLGGIAAVILVLGLLTAIGWLGIYLSVLPLQAIFFLIAVVGGLLMGWAGWQEFQAEGGKFQIGSGGPGTGSGTPPTAPPPSA
jgi:hypothetical protein